MNLTTISVSKIKKSLKLFIILSIVGLTAVFFYSSIPETYSHLQKLNPLFILIALGLNMFDWVIGGVRIYTLSKMLYPDLTYSTSFKSNISNAFLAGITPSQTGGGAAQVYVLYKGGMKLSKAIVSSLVCFLLSIIFLMLCFVYLVFIHQVEISNAILMRFSQVTVSIFLGLLGVFVFALTKPSAFAKFIHKLLSHLPRVEHFLEKKHSVEAFLESLLEFRDTIKFYLKNGKLSLLGGFICTALIYLNKFTIAYIVVRGMGIKAFFSEVLYIQMLLIVIFYFSPTPGASGVAEPSAALLMSTIIEQRGARATFVILWRTFTLYVSVAVGGFLFLRFLVKKSREPETEDESLD